MRLLIRYFFRTVRIILTPIVIVWDVITTPKGIVRSAADQTKVDAATSNLFLYHYRACPFCIKVKREMKRLSLTIDGCDANRNIECREDLILGGGKQQVPCLKINENGKSRWLYESDDIIAYLKKEFAA